MASSHEFQLPQLNRRSHTAVVIVHHTSRGFLFDHRKTSQLQNLHMVRWRKLLVRMANSKYRIVLECNRLSGTVGVSVSAGWSQPGHYRPASPYGRLVFLRKSFGVNEL
ncbi:hypothetical protein Tsp_10644 [Trichinella spiralis]|uniref:hypothetical protein n=1 Tax=Trichinella spiralis TaxID=6334 RepID=UPI0001EFDBB9|nr:hypothetical protein Tsp_10644 [Trichinella spiralis]